MKKLRAKLGLDTRPDTQGLSSLCPGSSGLFMDSNACQKLAANNREKPYRIWGLYNIATQGFCRSRLCSLLYSFSRIKGNWRRKYGLADLWTIPEVSIRLYVKIGDYALVLPKSWILAVHSLKINELNQLTIPCTITRLKVKILKLFKVNIT